MEARKLEKQKRAAARKKKAEEWKMKKAAEREQAQSLRTGAAPATNVVPSGNIAHAPRAQGRPAPNNSTPSAPVSKSSGLQAGPPVSSHALLQTAQTPLADGQSTDDQHVGDRHYRGPVISFGFGGVLVSTGSRSCSLYPSTGVGAVVVDKTAVFAKESYYLKQLEEFPGPFPTNTMDHFARLKKRYETVEDPLDLQYKSKTFSLFLKCPNICPD